MAAFDDLIPANANKPGRFVPDEKPGRFVPDEPKPWEKDWSGKQGKAAPVYLSEDEVFGKAKVEPKYLDPKEVFGSDKGQGKPWEQDWSKSKAGAFSDLVPSKTRTWGEFAGDTSIDLAKGVVGLGESVVGLTDLATFNLSGKGWAELGFDPETSNKILSNLYSDYRKEANRNVIDAKGFVDTTKALVNNPSAIVGGVAESAPLMLGSIAAVRTVAVKMLAAHSITAGTPEAAAFLARPEVMARLTAAGSAAEGATTSGQIQEQGRQGGRDYWDTAPSAVAAGVGTAVIGYGSSRIPGFHDSEVGAAIAGLGGKQRQTLITEGKELAKATFKEGVLEELPQSAQEQIWTNLAMGKPWDEGVGNAAAQGMVVGVAQGGGMHAYSAGRNALAKDPTKPVDTQTEPASPDAPVPPSVVQPAVPDATPSSSASAENRQQLPGPKCAWLSWSFWESSAT